MSSNFHDYTHKLIYAKIFLHKSIDFLNSSAIIALVNNFYYVTLRERLPRPKSLVIR